MQGRGLGAIWLQYLSQPFGAKQIQWWHINCKIPSAWHNCYCFSSHHLWYHSVTVISGCRTYWAKRAWDFIYCKRTCKSYWTWHHFRAFPLISRPLVDHSTISGIWSHACGFHIKYTTNPGLSITFHFGQLYYSLVLSLLKAQKLIYNSVTDYHKTWNK